MSSSFNGPPRGTTLCFDFGSRASGSSGSAALFTQQLAHLVNLDPAKSYEACITAITLYHPGEKRGLTITCDLVRPSYSADKMIQQIGFVSAADQAGLVESERTHQIWFPVARNSFNSLQFRINWKANETIPDPPDQLEFATRGQLLIREVIAL